MYPRGVCRIRKPAYAGNGCAIFPVFDTEDWAEKIRSQPQTISSELPQEKKRTPRGMRFQRIIRFLDKMVNTILSCESFAGRRWRREMYGLTFFAATPRAAETAAE